MDEAQNISQTQWKKQAMTVHIVHATTDINSKSIRIYTD